MESKGISIILYPRSYNKRGHHSLHSAQGLTPDGREVNVKLRLEEKHLGQDYAPSIAEFAREDRKATRACIASGDNGPGNREGILLFTQAIPDSKSNAPQETYIAKWASVLAEDSESPEPFFGFARMQISKNSSAIVKLKEKLQDAIKAGASPTDIMALESRIQDTRNYSYPAIFYYPEFGTELKDGDQETFFTTLAESVSKHSHNNLLGGCQLRWTDSEGRIDPATYKEIFPRFDGTKNAFETPTAFAQRVIRDFSRDLLKSKGGNIEVIPLIRINTGQASSAHYGQQNRFEMVKRLYYDESGRPLLCRASARISYYEHNGRTYLSRLHALTEPLGDPRRLSLSGQFDKLFLGEKPKLNVDFGGEGRCSEVPAGHSIYREGTNLSLDFFFSKDRYMAALEETVKDATSSLADSDERSKAVALEDASEETIASNGTEMVTDDNSQQITPNGPSVEDRDTGSISEPTDDLQVDADNENAESESGQATEMEDSEHESKSMQEEDSEDSSSTWLADIEDDLDLPNVPVTEEVEGEDGFFDDLPSETERVESNNNSEPSGGCVVTDTEAGDEILRPETTVEEEDKPGRTSDTTESNVTPPQSKIAPGDREIHENPGVDEKSEDEQGGDTDAGGLAAFLNL